MRIATLAIALLLAACGTVGGAYTSPLAATRWQLVELRAADATATRPADATRYTLSFGGDGSVAMQLDCNRGAGTWTSPRDNEISITPLAVTRAFCGEASLDTRIAQQLRGVRTYARDGDQLTLTMQDGGAQVWARQR